MCRTKLVQIGPKTTVTCEVTYANMGLKSVAQNIWNVLIKDASLIVTMRLDSSTVLRTALVIPSLLNIYYYGAGIGLWNKY